MREKEHQLGTQQQTAEGKSAKGKGGDPEAKPQQDLLALSDFLLLVMSVWFEKIVQYYNFQEPAYLSSPGMCPHVCAHFSS